MQTEPTLAGIATGIDGLFGSVGLGTDPNGVLQGVLNLNDHVLGADPNGVIMLLYYLVNKLNALSKDVADIKASTNSGPSAAEAITQILGGVAPFL